MDYTILNLDESLARQFHEQSEKLAIEAELAFLNNEYERSHALYQEAADLEKKAYENTDVKKSRSRGILAVSMLSLYKKADNFFMVYWLKKDILEDKTLPDFAVEEVVKFNIQRKNN